MRKNIVIALLAAAVAGLTAAVIVDRSTAAPAPVQRVALTQASVSQQQAFGTLAASAGGPMKLLNGLSTEIGVPSMTIIADLRAGQSLDQIAGAKAPAVRSTVIAMVTKELSTAVTKGAITPADETRLLNDANDALSVLMSAKLGLLVPSR